MRFTSFWRMAMILPKTMHRAHSTASSGSQYSPSMGNATNSTRIMAASPAALEPIASMAVTGAGAPWYTSGAHMWKGITDSLKKKPISTRVMPAIPRGKKS